MNTYRKIIYNLMIPMVLIVPFWLTFGRAFLGSSGWLTISFLLGVGPLLIVLLSVINALIRALPGVKTSKSVGQADSIMLGAFYLLALMYGAFVVDGGDTADSLASVLSHVLGRGFIEISDRIAGILLVMNALLLLGLFIWVIYESLRRKRPV